MEVYQWTNGTGSAVASGAVVKVGVTGQAWLGIALEDIANGATGSVGYNCIATVAKVSAAVWGAGEFVIWDESADAFDDNAATPASGDVSTNAAVAVNAGANLETTASIRFTGIPGTLTA
jgi:predicted RecA/RadA family phage recombinase